MISASKKVLVYIVMLHHFVVTAGTTLLEFISTCAGVVHLHVVIAHINAVNPHMCSLHACSDDTQHVLRITEHQDVRTAYTRL